jgi:hypothetical protein
VGVFDPATATWFLENSPGPGSGDAGVFPFGPSGGQPLAGAYNGRPAPTTPAAALGQDNLGTLPGVQL